MEQVKEHIATKLIPQLRFKDFDGEWVDKKLGDVLKITSAARVHKEEWTEKGVPFFRSSDVVADFKGTKNTKAYISEGLFETLSNKTGRVKKGDLLVTGGGSIGIPFLMKNNEPLYFKDADLLWIKNTNEISGYFLYSFLITPSFRKYLKSISHIGTIAHYTVIQAKNTPCQFPSLPEQQKIASFLSVVDEKIQQLTKKKALLEQYKKGVMQQLFSGQLRFKDENGNPYPDWEEKKIGDFLVESRIKGDTGDIAKKLTVKLWGRGVFAKKDVTEGSAQTQYFKRKSGQFLYSKLDFLNCAFAIIPEELDGLQSTVDLPCFDFKKEIHPYYILEKVKQRNFYKQFGDRADGSRKAKRIHADTFCSFSISVPCKKEQLKIVTHLLSLDTKIGALNNQTTQTQTFKKGLLQQMFV